MKLIKLNCNNCNAPLEFDVDKLQAYCPYCGQKLLIDLEVMGRILAEKEQTKRSKEKTKRAEEATKHAKEATKRAEEARKRAEEATKRAEEETRRAQIKYEYENKKDRRATAADRLLWIAIIFCAIFLLVFSVLMFYMDNSEKKEHQLNNDIQVLVSSKDLKQESVENATQILRNCGFESVTVTNKEDLVFGFFSKEGEIDSITINGNKKFSKGDWFPADSIVEITYHGFSDD